MKRFEAEVALRFGLAAAVLAAVGAAALISLANAVATGRRVEHVHNILRNLEVVLSSIKDAETGQRGYLLTGDERYLEPYQKATRELDGLLDDLARGLSDDPDQAAQLESLRVPVAAKMKELRETITLRRRSGLDAALPVILSDRGKANMDEIRVRARRMTEAEDARLGELTATADLAAFVAMGVSAVGIVAALVLLAFAFRMIARELAARRRTEADLARLATIVASTDDAVVGKAIDGTITSWNAGAERLYGYSAREMIGRNVSNLLPASGVDEVPAMLEKVARGEHPGALEVSRRRRDGSIVEVELRVSPIRDDAGAVVGAATIARDVTERKRAEALLRRRTAELEAAQGRLAAAAEFSGALNLPGMLETYRAAVGSIARVAGAPLVALYDAIEGRAPEARCVIGPDLRPLEASALRGDGLPATVAASGEPAELLGPFEDARLRVRFGLGEAGLHAIQGWPVSYRGRTLGVLVTAHAAPLGDDRRAFIRAALDQLAVRMDGYQVERQRLDLLADLQAQARDLEAARREADRANRAKSEFLAAMSHELRTPMNSIMGFTARLIRKLGDTLPERELDALRTVDRNAKHLLNLINDILDLSKIEAGKMEVRPERVDLGAIAREAAGQATSLLDGKPVELVLALPESGPFVDADPRLIRQVLLNLLSNAAKFTDRGRVEVSAAEATDDSAGRSVRLSVRDTGIGIRPEDRARLFRPFSQLDGGPNRKAGGTGLGLSLSERMVRLHGGRIEVESEPGRGSEFAVILPLTPAPAPQPAASGPAHAADPRPRHGPAPGHGVTILCVDDEPDVLKYLRLTFEDAGYRTALAGDGDEAMEVARAARPDLICLDLAMPRSDGFALLARLRADPALARVPVLVVSATSEEARALGAGARRYLPKPASCEDLVAAVRDLLGPRAAAAGDLLIVEDDPDTRRLLAATLEEQGFRVRIAADGSEALDRMAEGQPAGIVLDLMMPVMDGFAFLERVGRDPAWRRIPVVVMTAKVLDPEEVALLGRSCSTVLVKGRGDAGRLADAILQAVLPVERPEEAPAA